MKIEDAKKNNFKIQLIYHKKSYKEKTIDLQQKNQTNSFATNLNDIST